MMNRITRASQSSKAFTLVELLVVVAIIALLVSILLPTLGRAKEAARQAVCAANLKHISLGSTMYASAFDDYMVTNYNGWTGANHLHDEEHRLWWHEALHLYGGLPLKSIANDTSSIFWCPSASESVRRAEGVPYPGLGDDSFTTYALSRRFFGDDHKRLADIEQPSERFCFADNNNSWVSDGGYNDASGYNWWAFLRHNGNTNMVFADGHAEKGFELPLPMYEWTDPPPYPW